MSAGIESGQVQEGQVEVLQDQVYELMRARLVDLFGPGGSFRITLGRPTSDDAVFVETVADTIAWDVASSIDRSAHEPRRLADQLPEDEHEAIWKYVEEELLRRRMDTDSIPTAARVAA
jgi:hypothetical protein